MSSNIVKPLPIGTVINSNRSSYSILKVLGQGSYGITYLASAMLAVSDDTFLVEIRVVVKELFMKGFNDREETSVTNVDNETFADCKTRFLDEAANLRKLNDPKVVRVFESFEDNGTVYYSMEYAGGGSLEDKINATGGLPEPQVLDYAAQIGEVLDYIHSRGMLHLDLKPKNIMLDDNGKIRLIDFGTGKFLEGRAEAVFASGTPGYTPLEQTMKANGSFSTQDAGIDIYAFGATMFKMITGEDPAEASVILNGGFPAELLWSKCSRQLISIVQKCMAPVRQHRYHNISEVLSAIYGQIENYGHAEETAIVAGPDDQETLIRKETPFDGKIRIPHDAKGIYIAYSPAMRSECKSFAICDEGMADAISEKCPENQAPIYQSRERWQQFAEDFNSLAYNAFREPCGPSEADTLSPTIETITFLVYGADGDYLKAFSVQEGNNKGEISTEIDEVKQSLSSISPEFAELLKPEKKSLLKKLVSLFKKK